MGTEVKKTNKVSSIIDLTFWWGTQEEKDKRICNPLDGDKVYEEK